jgi:hemoglobin
VVNYFSDALIENKLVGKDSPNEFLRNWSRNDLDRLPGLKWMRTLWLASLAGGPYTYVPTVPGKCPFGLENAHAKFKITPSEFDAVAAELGYALDHFGVKSPEKDEVLGSFAMHKPEVTHSVTNSKIACPHKK